MKFSTIGIFAHANAGKTTVTENMLYEADLIPSCGRVDKGNTITDNLKTEKERGITIKSTYITIELDDLIIQLLDTPGHVDFSAEVIRAISVLDAAILIISGADGIEPQTINIWKMLVRFNIPVVFFINKLDRIGANYSKILEIVKNTFTKRLVNFQDILILEDNIIVNRRSDNSILEQLAEFDESSLVTYLSEITESEKTEWLHKRIIELYAQNKAYFVLGGSALNGIGVRELLDFLKEFLPYFKECANKNFSGRVYMVKGNNKSKETYIKILSGNLKNRMEILTKNGMQKVKALKKVAINRKVDCESAIAGQLVIVTGLDCHIGEYIGHSIEREYNNDINLLNLNPMFTAILSVEGENERTVLWRAISNMNEEDPYLNCRYEISSNSVLIDIMGKLQGETIVQMIKEEYDLDVKISEPKIVYKETIVDEANGKAGYTKTSNIALKIVPSSRNTGVKVTSLLGTDYLFEKYQKQAERLINRYIKYGLFGWEVTDVEVYLIGGKCDNVGSEPKDYNIAVPIALKRALIKSKTKLLEPVVQYSIKCPKQNYSVVVSKLVASKKGYDSISSIDEDNYLIIGKAYLSEIIQFIGIVQQITSGKGNVEYINNGYDDALTKEAVYGNMKDSDPINELKFVLSMNGNFKYLDVGLETKRGKPEKIKRNKHLWK